MTEGVLVNDAETQTNLPLPDCMYSFLKNNPMRFNKYYYNLDSVSKEQAESEKHLQRIRETRKEINKLNQKSKKRRDRDKSRDLSDDSISSGDDSNYLKPLQKLKMKKKIPDTWKQWYFPENATNFQPYTYITNRPSGTMPKDTSSFRNMQFSPHFERPASSTCKCQCRCGTLPKKDISQEFVQEIVDESSSLLNELESLRISKSKWKNDPEFQYAFGKEIDRLSERYNPMLSKNREKLEALEKKIKNPPIPKTHFEYLKIKEDEDDD